MKRDVKDYDLNKLNHFTFISLFVGWHWNASIRPERTLYHPYVVVADRHPGFVSLLLDVAAADDRLRLSGCFVTHLLKCLAQLLLAYQVSQRAISRGAHHTADDITISGIVVCEEIVRAYQTSREKAPASGDRLLPLSFCVGITKTFKCHVNEHEVLILYLFELVIRNKRW